VRLGCAGRSQHTAVVTKCDHYERLRSERTNALLLTEEIFLKGYYQHQFTVTRIYPFKISRIDHVVITDCRNLKITVLRSPPIYIKIRELVQKLKLWNVKTNPNTRGGGQRERGNLKIITSSLLGNKGGWREGGCIYKISL
jgi:hypothetical protein